MPTFLTLIETDGNQRFIFGTNRLRQNVGASELIFRAGTQVVLDAIARHGGPDCRHESARERAARLLEAAATAPIESGAEHEVVIATSGRAIFLSRSAESARRVVSDVTRWAAREAPGLSVAGVTRSFEFGTDPIHDVSLGLARELPRVRGALPPPQSRFLRLPIVADCATSGLPASEYRRPTQDEDPELQSVVARAKYEQASRALQRLRTHVPEGARVARSIDDLERQPDLPVLGVVHADGNGIGAVFLEFDERVGTAGNASGNRRYVDMLRRFSLGLELATESAFATALADLGRDAEDEVVPVVPLVLGGDDFTAVCDGRVALRLARGFLAAFEETTRAPIDPVGDAVARVSGKAFGVARLAACAGVVIVKPHFPFYAAYALAEALLAEAKRVKQIAVDATGTPIPCSALDFHVHTTASGADLRSIRDGRSSRDARCRLWAGPYVVTPRTMLDGVSDRARLEAQHFSRLLDRVTLVRAEDEDGRRRLPSSMLHDLRTALFEGQAVVDARVRLALPRYGSRGLADLLESDSPRPSLFRDEPAGSRHSHMTSFLDVLDVSEFW